jgi:DNA-binding response OmpR family regulator
MVDWAPEPIRRPLVATKIAVIDDSDTALDWVKTNLPPMGFEVSTFNTPIGTQAFIITTKPDLILLDVRMPGLDGDVLCKMIKSNPKTRSTVIALYSEMEEADLAQLADKCSADGYIKKTEDVTVLTKKINELLLLKKGIRSK